MSVAGSRPAAWLVVGIVAIGIIPPVAAIGPDEGITLTGRVLDEDGRPIAGARVARGSDLRGMEEVPEASTDADGRFVLKGVPAGPTVLTVQAPGHAPDLKSVDVAAGLAPVEFRLGRGHAIRGRLVDTRGKPIAGAAIAADRWHGHHSLRWSARTDAEGRFRWDDAPADEVLFDLGRLGFKGRRFATLTPDAAEATIRMRRPLHVRGRVTDAETGRPIKEFTLMPGTLREREATPSWDHDEAQEVFGVSYEVLLSTTATLRVVRIEAEGCAPATSRPLRDDEEGVVVHFALRRGPAGVTGVVRRPDRSLVAGAEVMLATPSHPVQLSDGRPYQAPLQQWVARSRADGRFRLPPQEPPYTIVALHDWGYALRDVDARPAAPPELTIQPWGRVAGTLRLGGRPGARLQLAINRIGRTDPRPRISWGSFAVTDAEGRFTFKRVVPGEIRISRVIPLGRIFSLGGSPSATIDVAPGATVRLALGGTGRPIVGRATVPAEFADRDDWHYDLGELSREPIASRRAGYSSVFQVERDGSFRIEDVEAGTYELRIIAREGQGPAGPGGEVIATVRREAVVPEMPGGRSDDPLDLGEIPLKVEK